MILSAISGSGSGGWTFNQSERLAAAHSIMALTAYFDVLAAADLPFDARELEFTKAEQAALAVGGPPRSAHLGALAAGLLHAEIPLPAPQRPYEAALEEMRTFTVICMPRPWRLCPG